VISSQRALRFCPDMIENLPVWGFRIPRLGRGARKHGIVSKPSDDAYEQIFELDDNENSPRRLDFAGQI